MARELWITIELSLGGQTRASPLQLRDPVLLDDRGEPCALRAPRDGVLDADGLENVRTDDRAAFGQPTLADVRDLALESVETCAVTLRSAYVVSRNVVETKVGRPASEARAARATLLLGPGTKQERPPGELASVRLGQYGFGQSSLRLEVLPTSAAGTQHGGVSGAAIARTRAPGPSSSELSLTPGGWRAGRNDPTMIDCVVLRE